MRRKIFSIVLQLKGPCPIAIKPSIHVSLACGHKTNRIVLVTVLPVKGSMDGSIATKSCFYLHVFFLQNTYFIHSEAQKGKTDLD